MRTSLALPYMLGIDVISFSISMSLLFFCIIFSTKKKWGEIAGNFPFLADQILHVFSPDILILYALIYFA
jgi:hypothetical protein